MKMIDTVLKIEAKSGVCIIIPLNNKVSILTGDSATGKTKLINYIGDLLKDTSEIKNSSINIKNIKVCHNEEDVIELMKRNIKNNIIIIDRFDTMSNEDNIMEFIRESSNYFIVAAHKEFKQCGYSTDSMLGLNYNDLTYKAYKLFPTPADYFKQSSQLI